MIKELCRKQTQGGGEERAGPGLASQAMAREMLVFTVSLGNPADSSPWVDSSLCRKSGGYLGTGLGRPCGTLVQCFGAVWPNLCLVPPDQRFDSYVFGSAGVLSLKFWGKIPQLIKGRVPVAHVGLYFDWRF